MSTQLEIVYFTDPFCSWCWALEPSLLRLQETYGDGLRLRYAMGGLVRDMSDFLDAANGIRSTADVVPHWREVAERTGQPIDERVMQDIQDPHFSSWPACIAVKAAELQGTDLAAHYLRRMRRAVMTERRQIQQRAVQLELASEVPGLDAERLGRDLETEEPRRRFEADLALAREFGVSGFPTLVFLPVGGAAAQGGILVNGFRPLETYHRVIAQLAPDLASMAPRALDDLLAAHGPLTTRELAAILGQPSEKLAGDLEARAGSGQLVRMPARGGELWSLPVHAASLPGTR